MMETIKIRIDDQDDSAVISCPICQKSTEVPITALGFKHHLNVKCACESVFVVEVETRDRSRKRVDFPGFYEIIKNRHGIKEDCTDIRWANSQFDKKNQNCLITDLSKGGIGFIVLDDQKIKFGDFVNLHFKLDDNAKSRISQTCLVKHINDNFVGCRMLKENTSMGLYLRA